MVAQTFNPSTWEKEAGGSLVYIVSSKTAYVETLCLKSKNKKTKQKKPLFIQVFASKCVNAPRVYSSCGGQKRALDFQGWSSRQLWGSCHVGVKPATRAARAFKWWTISLAPKETALKANNVKVECRQLWTWLAETGCRSTAFDWLISGCGWDPGLTPWRMLYPSVVLNWNVKNNLHWLVDWLYSSAHGTCGKEFFYCVCCGDQAQVASLGSQCLYLLSHLASSERLGFRWLSVSW